MKSHSYTDVHTRKKLTTIAILPSCVGSQKSTIGNLLHSVKEEPCYEEAVVLMVTIFWKNYSILDISDADTSVELTVHLHQMLKQENIRAEKIQ